MRARVASLLADMNLERPPRIATFHSFCVRMLRRDGDGLAAIRPGFTKTFSIYDDEDQMAIVKAAYKRMGLDEKAMPYRATLAQISQAKSAKKTPQEMYSESADPRVTKVAAVFEEYEKRCIRRMRSISTICCSKASACFSTIKIRGTPGIDG